MTARIHPFMQDSHQIQDVGLKSIEGNMGADWVLVISGKRRSTRRP